MNTYSELLTEMFSSMQEIKSHLKLIISANKLTASYKRSLQTIKVEVVAFNLAYTEFDKISPTSLCDLPLYTEIYDFYCLTIYPLNKWVIK